MLHFERSPGQVDKSTPLPELIGNMKIGEDQWVDAELAAAYAYARASKLLNIPEEFRAVIPSSI